MYIYIIEPTRGWARPFALLDTVTCSYTQNFSPANKTSMNFLRNFRALRQVHHRVKPSQYPKVNVEDVELNPPRYGFRKERGPLLHQQVTDTLFPAEEIKKLYKEQGKPVPIRFKADLDAIQRRNYEKFQEEVAAGLPHFRVGEQQVYFPKGRVCLLRPSAKHTPYQAKFVVPRSFNKMDLRDYLWHCYGLRALRVTSQLLHSKWNRSMDDVARHRGPQYKKMTIDMEQPFIWPDLPEDLTDHSRKVKLDQVKYMDSFRGGSSKEQPTGAFGGLYDKPALPQAFVLKKNQQKLQASLAKHTAAEELLHDRAKLAKFLNLL